MKKFIIFIGIFSMLSLSGYAQKYALIDMEYILKKIPAYENSNKQLDAASKQWQKEVDAKATEVQNLYKKYQAEAGKLNPADKATREKEIVTKEKEIQQIRNKYFGPEGELYKRRQSLMTPIQDAVYNAVKEISAEQGYQLVMDRASANSIIFASPNIDISDQVLNRLGY